LKIENFTQEIMEKIFEKKIFEVKLNLPICERKKRAGKFLRFIARFRIVTAIIGWYLARRYYYGKFNRKGELNPNKNKPRPMRYPGALAFHLLRHPPDTFERLPWNPVLQARRAFRAAGSIEPCHRHCILWVDGAASELELSRYLRDTVVEFPVWTDFLNKCLTNRRTHDRKNPNTESPVSDTSPLHLEIDF